jgi:hypothetical protein
MALPITPVPIHAIFFMLLPLNLLYHDANSKNLDYSKIYEELL